jgi:hypothetical protein
MDICAKEETQQADLYDNRWQTNLFKINGVIIKTVLDSTEKLPIAV